MIIIGIVSASEILPQLSYNISTEQIYSDNPFLSKIAEKTLISSADYSIEHSSDFINISYNGSFYNFEAIPERNFYRHNLSLWKSFDNSTLGISADQRFGKDVYTYFDYTSVTAYYTQLIKTGNFNISFSPIIDISKYNSISILDNLKGSLNYSINYGIEPGTTFIFGGAFTYKQYLDPKQSGSYSYIDSTNQLITETYTDKNVSSLSQVLSLLRIAQSITPTTGIAVQFTNRSVLSGFGNFVKDLNMVYGDESEIFDDPVNYEGNNFLVELTQILFEDLTIKGFFLYNNKNYPSQGIYDVSYNYNTGIMRSDKQKIFQLFMNKDFTLNADDDVSLSASLNYQRIENLSNSYLFDYDSNTISLNIGLDF